MTSSAGANGAISPVGDQVVNYKAVVTFTVTTNAGYHIDSVTGCGGVLTNNSYVTAPMTANCQVSAYFTKDVANTFAVTPSAGEGGSINPATAVNVNIGGTTMFSIKPDDDHVIKTVTGCDGTLIGNVYLTGVVNGNCTVAAVFAPEPPASGDLDANGMVDTYDALKALRIAMGLQALSKTDLERGDVAPYVDGVPMPDGAITIGDVVVILRKSVGLVSW